MLPMKKRSSGSRGKVVALTLAGSLMLICVSLAATRLLDLAGSLSPTAAAVPTEKEDRDEDAVRPDRPDEAVRFRNLQLQDEKKQIPADGLLKAKAQMDRMRAAQAERAIAAGKPQGIE